MGRNISTKNTEILGHTAVAGSDFILPMVGGTYGHFKTVWPQKQRNTTLLTEIWQ